MADISKMKLPNNTVYNLKDSRVAVPVPADAVFTDHIFSGLAEDVNYDNSDSGLTSTTVQDALDEIADGGGSTGCVELTQAQYDALSEEEKMDDVIYLITDSPDNYLVDVFGDFASIEYASTASKAYSANTYLIYNNDFYRVTSSIAQGDTIVPDTNVVKTTVGDEIKSIRNTSSSHYCKMPDGTLMEWGFKSVTTGTSQAPLGYNGSALVKFAPYFVSAPMVTVSANEVGGWWSAAVTNVTASQATVWIAGDIQNASRNVYWHAIGRWK